MILVNGTVQNICLPYFYILFFANTDLSTVSMPSFFSSTSTWRIFFLSNVCKCCFRHPHPRLLHNQLILLFGTLTTVSLNCPGGTGVLCWRRKTFNDRAFQNGVCSEHSNRRRIAAFVHIHHKEMCNTYIQRRRDDIKKLAHGLVSHRMRQILREITMQHQAFGLFINPMNCTSMNVTC